MTQDAVDRIVAQWAQERPELETAAMAVFGRVFRLSRLVGDEMEAVYARHDLGRPDFDVLATLRRSGPPYELSPGALASSMMLSSGGTTARLDRLEKAGLVERAADPGDRRGVLVRLTTDGTRTADAAVTAGLTRQQELLSHLSGSEQAQLSELLRRLLAPLEAGTRPHPSVRPRSVEG